jgi:hypothetical protein
MSQPRFLRRGSSKVDAKPLGMRKFSGFLPKATTTLERPCAAVPR